MFSLTRPPTHPHCHLNFIKLHVHHQNKSDVREKLKICSVGLNELKRHKLWFDEESLHFLDQRKQPKMQWIRDTRHINVDNLNNVRREGSRHFMNKIRLI
jgi:hypothetical protein